MSGIPATSTLVSLRILDSQADPVLKPSAQTSGRIRTVLIVKSALEQYRIPFFGGLQKRLADENIQLRVAVPKHRCSTYSEDWLLPVSGGDFHLLGRTLSWQAIRSCARGAHLIINSSAARELTQLLASPVPESLRIQIGTMGSWNGLSACIYNSRCAIHQASSLQQGRFLVCVYAGSCPNRRRTGLPCGTNLHHLQLGEHDR